MTTKQPLNQILYGPPGTGKTYNTIYKALDILEPTNLRKDNSEEIFSWGELESLPEEQLSKWDKNEERNGEKVRDYAMIRFNSLKEEERIVMTTFHQSMSYEDFVEGIKPQTDDTISELTYTVEKGIFMRICENAYENYRLSISPKGTAEKEYSIEEKIDQFISEAIENKTEFETKNGSKFYIVDFDEYIVQIIVPANEKNADVKVRIKDLKVLLTELPVQTIGEIPPKFGRKKKQQYDSYLFVLTSLIRDSFKEVNTDKEDLTEKCIEEQNYVLIVDEINRGNVANIFGELITLIEEDKRIGNKEELRVKLPYSPKREFGVPRNLYIIGTMNTADRSVEALDSALRRRFSFTEMMPKPELLKYNGKYVEIKDTEHTLANLLYTINKRIEVLKDREHQIGHSYFMQFCKKASVEPKELKDVFYNKIIPLLQEYFYGDYEKIRMVLSPDFVVKEEKKVAELFKNIDKSSNSEIDIEAPYQLKEIDITDEVINNMHLVNQYPISQSPKAEQV